MNLTQSTTFIYRGLVVKRVYHSHTQSAYNLSSPDGTATVGGFNGEVDAQQGGLGRMVNDGRKNPYQLTDNEIRKAIDRFFEVGANFGHASLIDKLAPFLKKKAGDALREMDTDKIKDLLHNLGYRGVDELSGDDAFSKLECYLEEHPEEEISID